MPGGVLITGGTGQVGGALLRVLAPLRSLVGELHAPARAELDLADAGSIRTVVQTLRPQWIVNAGAYTTVDRAEAEPELAHAINAEAPCILGEEARKIGAAVLHFSTDYVFSGRRREPYTEDDATGPLGVYGASKLAGEQALAEATPAHVILRTSWVYGSTGKNFLLTVLRIAQERTEMKVVADQHGAPTWSDDLARLAGHIIAHSEAVSAAKGTPINEAVWLVAGVYHAAGAGETTWHGFAEEAVRQMQAREPGRSFATIRAISTSEYLTAAKRPLNSRLNCDKLHHTFCWRMPVWQESLRTVLEELNPKGPRQVEGLGS